MHFYMIVAENLTNMKYAFIFFFFFFREKIPDVSALMTSKLAFRALHTNNIGDLKALLEKTEGVTNVS